MDVPAKSADAVRAGNADQLGLRAPALLDNLRREPDRRLSIDRYARLSGHYEKSTTRIRFVRRRVIDRLGLTSGETVFDVGCGAGAMLPDLASRVGPLGHVIGIEQSPQMAALARCAAEGIGQIEILTTAVEGFVFPQRADALAFVYTHDVQQSPQALANVFAHARPGARIVVAGLQLLPWWGLPINAWVVWGARHYVTTWRGLRQPWASMLRWCPDLQVVERFHHGTSYLAAGTVARQ
jgi:SAM-dependent methyltransferase